MSYELQPIAQAYGARQYLSHNIKQDDSPDHALFGMRVPSYGIINFGRINGGSAKTFNLSDNGINSDIELKSIYDFTNSSVTNEFTLKLYQGRAELLEQKLKNVELSYTFAPGAVINSSLSIYIKPKYNVNYLLMYWQPVHVLSYVEV